MTGTTDAPAQGSAATARRGSSFSDKQIYASVKEGRQIRVTVEGEPFEGWVYGVDDFHWGLVDAEGATVLVHKSAPVVVFLPSQKTTPRAERLVSSFRAWVLRSHYGQTTTEPTN